MFGVGWVVFGSRQFPGLFLPDIHAEPLPASSPRLLLVCCCGYFDANPFDWALTLCTQLVFFLMVIFILLMDIFK